MKLSINWIIGHSAVIAELSAKWINVKITELAGDFSLILLTERVLDDMNELANEGEELISTEFERLSKSIEAVLKENSYVKPLGYIELRNHNGLNLFSGIAYSQGEIIAGPSTSKSYEVVNRVLYKLGLERRQDVDAFNHLGLDGVINGMSK